MKNKISVMVVDDNKTFVDLVVEAINNEDDMFVCGKSFNGFEAIEKIPMLRPSIILLDIIMPNVDGIAVLEAIQSKLDYKPTIIMLTAIGQESFIKKAMNLGALFYILKPFGKETLINRIRQINNSEDDFSSMYSISETKYFSSLIHEKEKNIKIKEPKEQKEPFNNDIVIERIIQQYMHEFGIPIHMMGYNYLTKAVFEAVKNPGLIRAITKRLYPLVAESYNSTPSKVERAIRGCLIKAWQRRFNNNNFRLNDENNTVVKPTNSEFIATISDRIRIKLEME